MAIVRHLVRDEAGATAVEYGLIVALIAGAVLASLLSTGSPVPALWGEVERQVTAPR